jgi:cobalt-zinc-cadmium resistance protein CzcA
MIRRIVAAALRAPVLIILMALVLVVGGLLAYRQLDIEAYPNPVPPMVELITQPSGWSAEEVERFVSIPLENALFGMPQLDHVRSQSIFGLSDVKVYFKWGIPYAEARQEVINRLQFVQLPPDLQPRISPINAIGEIYRYRLKGEGYTLQELKTAQDWILERQFRQVPGVIDVVGFGGETKQFHVNVDPIRLKSRDVTLSQLKAAIQNSSVNVGGQRIFLGEQSFDVRGIGLINNEHDIEDIVISAQGGTPIRVKDVAEVEIGHAPRLGIVGKDEDPDIVEGVILMRYGAKTAPTLKGIYAKIEEIRRLHLLPPGMELEPFYDRGTLVKVTTHTVLHNLLEGMLLVTLILVLFLGSVRAALITAINIPLALLVAFGGMVLTGTPANLISLGAVDFGIVVDSTVIMMESIFRHTRSREGGGLFQRVLNGASEVGKPMLFSAAIIATVFIPLFLLSGVEGVIFSPMARTYALAIAGAFALAVTLTPVLSLKLLKPRQGERELLFMKALHRIYTPAADLALRWPRLSSAIALLLSGLCFVLFLFLGGEFMPKLEEGNFWIRATLPTSISLDQAATYVGTMRRIIRGCPTDPKEPCTKENQQYPQVLTVVSQLGRPDDGTEIAGFYNVELFAPLENFDEWPKGETKASLTEKLSKSLQKEFPGVVFNFSQIISDNVEEALSGIKGENSVKVVGPDLHVNEKTASTILQFMEKIRGVEDLGMFRSLGQPAIKIAIDRQASARYGINVGDVAATVEAAIGGTSVIQVYEQERHFDLTVRWKEPFRNSVPALQRILVSSPDGLGVPLGELAKITIEEGPSVIYREDGKRYTPVKFSVRGRDVASTVEEAQREARQISLPYDTHLDWAGQLDELKAAVGRLSILVPLTLLLLAMLVFSAVRNWIDMLIILHAIPLACTGGVIALLLTGIHFSVSAAMGFVSVAGVAIQDAILVVTFFQRLRAEGHSLTDAARDAAAKGFRPVLMTTLVAMAGLLPAAVSHGIGSQTQKPLAVVVIGGAFMLAALTRVIRPPMLVVAHRWHERRKRAGASSEK